MSKVQQIQFCSQTVKEITAKHTFLIESDCSNPRKTCDLCHLTVFYSNYSKWLISLLMALISSGKIRIDITPTLFNERCSLMNLNIAWVPKRKGSWLFLIFQGLMGGHYRFQ